MSAAQQTAETLNREIEAIVRRRPDITAHVNRQAHAVIVVLPETFGGFELAIRYEAWGVEVDARRARSFATWEPADHFGITFEVRP